MLAGMDAVQKVVAAHHCPGLAFFDRDLKRLQIQLA